MAAGKMDKNNPSTTSIPKALNIFNCFISIGEPYSCWKCDFNTQDHVLLKRHQCGVAAARKPNFYCCKKCKNFESYSLLIALRHCERCEIKSGSNQKYIKKDKWFECVECDHKTQRKGNLKTHVLLKHTHICRRHALGSSTAANNDTILKKNFTKSKKRNPTSNEAIDWYNCNYCDYKTIYKNILPNHIQWKHKIGNEDDAVNRLHCGHCDYKTDDESCLKLHMLGKHQRLVEEVNLFKCNLCHYSTRMMYNLRIHVQRNHAIWLTCKQCIYKTKDKSCLELHILRKHTPPVREVIWFRCELCNYYATRLKSDLAKHIQNKHKLNR